MTTNIMRLPTNDMFSVARRALHYAGRRASSIADRVAKNGANDLARLDRRALADTGYGRIDYVADGAQTALDYIGDAQFTADFANVSSLVFVCKTGISGDD